MFAVVLSKAWPFGCISSILPQTPGYFKYSILGSLSPLYQPHTLDMVAKYTI